MTALGTAAPSTSNAGSDSAGAADPKADCSTAVRIKGLHKSYGRTSVLRGVDLTVPEGSLTAILGASGSGKTTLLRVLAGFERADAGCVALRGERVDDGRRASAPEKRRIGYVPQDGALFPHLTVAGNIGFALRRGADRRGADRNAAVRRLLALIDMAEYADRYPHQLSGGQQQRVALARALAHEPTVVLLDEPFSALDAAMRMSVRAQILAALRTAGTTAILVTHDQDEALSMADQVAVLRDGIVVQQGTATELYQAPADPELALFLGAANLVPGRATDGDRVDLGPLGVLALRGMPREAGPVTALIRPEQLAVAVDGWSPDTVGEAAAPDAVGSTSAESTARGNVIDCAYYGHDTMLTIEADFPGPEGPLLARLPQGVQIALGTSVALSVRGSVAAWA